MHAYPQTCTQTYPQITHPTQHPHTHGNAPRQPDHNNAVHEARIVMEDGPGKKEHNEWAHKPVLHSAEDEFVRVLAEEGDRSNHVIVRFRQGRDQHEN